MQDKYRHTMDKLVKAIHKCRVLQAQIKVRRDMLLYAMTTL